MDDSLIIELFFERSEKALSELSSKYGGVCMKIAQNVLNNYQDAEECVNDTYLGVWNTIPPKKPNSLCAYVCIIARNISINRYKYNSNKKRNNIYDVCISELEDDISSNDRAEDRFEISELSRLIDDFLDTLDTTNQMLFIRRYWFLDSIETLALMSKLSVGTVRTRLSRLRDTLKKYLGQHRTKQLHSNEKNGIIKV